MHQNSSTGVVVQFQKSSRQKENLSVRPLTNGHIMVIAGRMIHALLNLDNRPRDILVQSECFDFEEAVNLAKYVRKSTVYGDNAIGDDACQNFLGRADAVFIEVFNILDAHNRQAHDIPERTMTTAKTGMAFTKEMRSDAFLLHKKRNPFLALHAAAIVLEDIGRDVELRKKDQDSFWVSIPRLRDELGLYCRELHDTVPLDATLISATDTQRQNTHHQLMTLYSYTSTVLASIAQRASMDLEKTTMNVLMDFLSPFSDEKSMDLVATCQKGTLLTISERISDLQEKAVRRAERHAAHPELFFSDSHPVIR